MFTFVRDDHSHVVNVENVTNVNQEIDPNFVTPPSKWKIDSIGARTKKHANVLLFGMQSYLFAQN